MRIVCLSDTHLKTAGLAVPDGDLLLHAGDLTGRGSKDEVRAALRWLSGLPHRHKVVIAGNHDWLFQTDPAAARALLAETDLVYLQDAEATVLGLRIWGSPWQPWFMDWAFNAERGADIRQHWLKIPPGIDVLITHGPPAGILDRTIDGRDVGCADLLDIVRVVRPKLHVFGHIHEGAGRVERDGVVFVNASTCDVRYRPVQAPVVVEW
jgi:Icc-related predicted phosphoesterase